MDTRTPPTHVISINNIHFYICKIQAFSLKIDGGFNFSANRNKTITQSTMNHYDKGENGHNKKDHWYTTIVLTNNAEQKSFVIVDPLRLLLS